MRTRVAVLVAAAALTLAACGQGDPPNLPSLNAGASTGESDGATAKQAAGSSTMSDMSMRANVRYELADGVTVDVDSAKAYKFGKVEKADVEKLAKAFGVTGAVQSDDYGYSVGVSKDASVSSDQRMPASLYVGKDGQFSYNGSYTPSATPACAEAEAADRADAAVVPDATCEAPTTTVPTKPLPSEDAAKKQVTDAMKTGGVDLDGATISTTAEPDFVSVRIVHSAGGAKVDGYEGGAAVNRDGEITYANGYLSTPSSVGDYDLASLQEAVDRLNNGMGNGGGARDLAATSDVGAAEPAIAIDEPMPAPSEPAEPTVIKLTSVKVGLMVSYASNELWLTPAYLFSGDEGAQVTAAAAADKYFPEPEPEPVQTDPAPADGGTSGGSSDGSTGSGGGTSGEPGSIEPAPPITKE